MDGKKIVNKKDMTWNEMEQKVLRFWTQQY